MSIEPIIPNIKPAIIPNTTVIHSKTSLTVKLLYNVFVRSIKLSVHGCLISIMCIYVYWVKWEWLITVLIVYYSKSLLPVFKTLYWSSIKLSATLEAWYSSVYSTQSTRRVCKIRSSTTVYILSFICCFYSVNMPKYSRCCFSFYYSCSSCSRLSYNMTMNTLKLFIDPVLASRITFYILNIQFLKC